MSRPALLAAVGVLALALPVHALAGELLFDNGTSKAIPYPNSRALSSWSSWHPYDDFLVREDAIIDEISFEIWHVSTAPSIKPEFRVHDSLLPVGVHAHTLGIKTHRPSNVEVVPNGKRMYSYTTWYNGFTVRMKDLNLPLSAGGYVLSLATSTPSVLLGFGDAGPDTADAPGLTCFRTRGGLGTRWDYCWIGHMSFKVYGRPVNEAPLADAGPDAFGRAGTPVTLDGTGSSDDRTALEDLVWSWTVLDGPGGAVATLAGDDTAEPTFTADIPGIYTVGLTVTDEDGAESAPDEVTVDLTNLAPTADPGVDQLVIVDRTVTLDGSGSYDPEGDAMTFAWSLLETPDGSAATVDDPGATKATFFADATGFYTCELTVSDPLGPGEPAFVEVEAVTVETYATRFTDEATGAVEALADAAVSSPGNRTALLAFLDQARDALGKGKRTTAAAALDRAAERTDGCPARGAPDTKGVGADWIVDCAAQRPIHAMIATARGALD